MIELDAVSVVRGNQRILDGISLCLTEHRIGVIGANGSGKSTLARVLNGLQTCSEGSVSVNRKAVEAGSGQVGFVFQNPDNQIVFPEVLDDIAFGLKHSGLSKEQQQARVETQLAELGLSHLSARLTHELSGGEKQLLALAGVLVLSPEWLVLDEPTTLLDLANRQRVIGMLNRLELPLVVVSHDLEFMQNMERLVWIDKGKVAGDGEPATVLEHYRQSVTC